MLFHYITWKEFFLTTITITGAYYAVITVMYYKKQIMQVFNGSLFKKLKYDAFQTQSAGEKNYDSNTSGILDTAIHKLINDIKMPIERISQSQGSKEELLYSLQQYLSASSFASLKDSELREGINELITKESEKRCSIQLDSNDLYRLWNTN